MPRIATGGMEGWMAVWDTRQQGGKAGAMDAPGVKWGQWARRG